MEDKENIHTEYINIDKNIKVTCDSCVRLHFKTYDPGKFANAFIKYDSDVVNYQYKDGTRGYFPGNGYFSIDLSKKIGTGNLKGDVEIQLPNTYQGIIELSCSAVQLTDFILPQAKFYICSNKVDIFNCILDDMWIEMEQLKILSSSINEIHIFRYKYATDDLVDIVINDSKIGEFIVPCHSNNFSFSNTHFQKLVLANGRCLVGSSSEVDSIYVERYNRVILTDNTLHQVETSFCNEIYYDYCHLEKGGCTRMNGGTLKLFHHDYQLVKDSSGLLLKKEDEIKHTIKVQKGKVLSKKKYITKKVMDISQK